jgi:predicted nuclease of predicted toxin-antitoxin system
LTKVKFLADESCDFIVVRTLRSGGYDVLSVAESFPSVSDFNVIQQAIKEERILLTEDKDFGEWVFAHGKDAAGVILIRFPGNARTQLGEEIRLLVDIHGIELSKSFVVLEPGRARLRKI